NRTVSTADGVTGLCVFVVLLFALPSAFVVAPLGSMGVPATLLGLAAFLWWVWHHVNRSESSGAGTQPLTWAAFALLGAILISYAYAMAGPMVSDEISPADTALLRLTGLLGVALLASDGVRSLARMETLIRCLIIMVSICAALSIIQFITGESWVDRITIPGFTQTTPLGLDE